MLRILILALTTSLLPLTAHAADETIGYKLTTLNAGERPSANDPTIAEYDTLVKKVSATFGIPADAIAEKTWAVTKHLRQSNSVKVTSLDLLKGVDLLGTTPKELNYDYDSTIAAVATMMIAESKK